MTCPTPSLKEHLTLAQAKDDVDLSLGIFLDGFEKYRDLKETIPDNSQLEVVCPDPKIYDLDEEVLILGNGDDYTISIRVNIILN